MAQQPDWRYCHKCHGMFFNGFPDKGVCPNGGSHEQVDSYNFVLPFDLEVTPTSQADWRYCHKCHGMFFNGFPDKGMCPNGGGHDQAGSFNFVLPCNLPQTPTAHFVCGTAAIVMGCSMTVSRKRASVHMAGAMLLWA